MEQIQNNTQDEIEIDLLEILRVLLSKIGVILLCGFMFALITFGVTKLFITPQYQSTTKMLVLAKQATNALTQSDMQTSTYLTKDYAELIKSRTVTETVIAQLGLGITHKDMLEKMRIQTPTDTRIIEIQISDPDPYVAAEIANSIRNVASDHIQKVMDTEAVNVVEDADIPQFAATPSVLKNMVIGGALGVFLAVAVILIQFMTNDTIQSSDDIERYLNMSALGVIPLTEGEKKTKKKKKRSRFLLSSANR